jgi:hypothetical protein
MQIAVITAKIIHPSGRIKAASNTKNTTAVNSRLPKPNQPSDNNQKSHDIKLILTMKQGAALRPTLSFIPRSKAIQPNLIYEKPRIWRKTLFLWLLRFSKKPAVSI